jgi:uncharacterized phiE125 gp8 family phage protein
MSLVLTNSPTIEPVSLAETKLHLRVDSPTDDMLIASLITTSRMQIEQALSLALLAQTWSYFIDAWPHDPLLLPLAPVIQLDLVRAFGLDDTPTVFLPLAFQLDGHAQPPRLARRSVAPGFGPLRKLNGIEIVFTAGFGAAASDVPAPIRHALLLLVAHWYEQRSLTDALPSNLKLPEAIAALLMPWRTLRLT